MQTPDYSKLFYLFEGVTGELLPDEMYTTVRGFIATENLYLSATREIATKLENLNDEFRYTHDRNPIHQIKTRVKTPASIMSKLKKKGCKLSVESARENLSDIAGVRVICSYIDDTYLIKDLLLAQDDIKLIRMSDYIREPKPNGYRSLHLIVTVPVFMTSCVEEVHVEVQIRTIAMDFWASLEHELAYKLDKAQQDSVSNELKSCAVEIADLDGRMQRLHNVSKAEQDQPGYLQERSRDH